MGPGPWSRTPPEGRGGTGPREPAGERPLSIRDRLRPVEAGLRRNARLFGLLVVVNGFVGAMVGLERALLPVLGEQVFEVSSRVALLSFIATFGLAKALTNLLAGAWAERAGRRKLLVLGWVVGLPVPLLLAFAPAPHWWLIVFANVLLGVNQGLCWSMAVVMKVDIAGERNRGLALGLNEFAGYAAVALAALASGFVAGSLGLRPWPFLLGLGFAGAGLLLSALLVADTTHLARAGAPAPSGGLALARDLHRLSWGDRRFLPLNQAGLVNNLNDGVAWGLLPLLFAPVVGVAGGLGLLVALYPLTWGVGQLGTGPLSDRWGRKGLIVGGMLLQGAALVAIALVDGAFAWGACMLLLGLGTAMVYPTLLGAVADAAEPRERATALGVYRFWRDLGFVVGALGGGLLADVAGLGGAVAGAGIVTAMSGVHVAVAFRARRREPVAARTPRDTGQVR